MFIKFLNIKKIIKYTKSKNYIQYFTISIRNKNKCKNLAINYY